MLALGGFAVGLMPLPPLLQPPTRFPAFYRPLAAHQSIAGGYYKAVEAARECGCECVQLFTKNNNQWRAKEISDVEAARFKGGTC